VACALNYAASICAARTKQYVFWPEVRERRVQNYVDTLRKEKAGFARDGIREASMLQQNTSDELGGEKRQFIRSLGIPWSEVAPLTEVESRRSSDPSLSYQASWRIARPFQERHPRDPRGSPRAVALWLTKVS